MNRKPKVLFLCTGNSCRSQMAEGWARHLKGDVMAPYRRVRDETRAFVGTQLETFDDLERRGHGD